MSEGRHQVSLTYCLDLLINQRLIEEFEWLYGAVPLKFHLSRLKLSDAPRVRLHLAQLNPLADLVFLPPQLPMHYSLIALELGLDVHHELSHSFLFDQITVVHQLDFVLLSLFGAIDWIVARIDTVLRVP